MAHLLFSEIYIAKIGKKVDLFYSVSLLNKLMAKRLLFITFLTMK
ncbi:hypothetical protein TRIP_D310071 [uncultured Paludibacter sp.]|uniref:Uncharacterized protein n=1 Tax=uncultured Paludibacter sp. TaxID=497635 RepID=A0A653ACE1_9BACT|nr:hypothetical protein TRIP_D310071 [uncultured Paludibacter sp.]